MLHGRRGIKVRINKSFWQGKKVFITGHTGFKGSWLSLWLHDIGAVVTGYALEPPTNPSLYQLASIDSMLTSNIADIRNLEDLKKAVIEAAPDIVFHLAAQPIVRDSYHKPVETYDINVMGTVHLLEAIRYANRKGKGIKAVINVTTDKCYENREWVWGYREGDNLGGYDPYSNSKACSELVTASFRNSFFHPKDYLLHGVGIASVRAGNVIGGGDWAMDRLIPDSIRSLLNREKIRIRNEHAIRPWQHVLEPLSGYMLLAEKLFIYGPKYGEGWNFGPNDNDVKPVKWIVKEICNKWGDGAAYELEKGNHPHEATYLKLDCSKAKTILGWNPKWNLDIALNKVVEWTRAYQEKKDIREVCLKQIKEYSYEA